VDEGGRHRDSGIRAGVDGRRPRSAAVALLGLLLAACLQPPTLLSASTFAGGTGVPGDPYRIADAKQLLAVGADAAMLSRHFVLVADIDLDPNQPGMVFSAPLIAPSSRAPFEGSLDGAGHVIKHLTLVVPVVASAESVSPAALFGYVAEAGVVRNLRLAQVDIVSPYDCVAGLVAHNTGALLQCAISGSVCGGPTTGGLVADNSGTLVLCRSACDVAGIQSVGGLAGLNSGTLSSCQATGKVTGDDSVGGLVGASDGPATSCCASGQVEGWTPVGGLIGHQRNLGSVACSYSTGSVSGQTSVGGLIGTDSGTVTDCYSTSTVKSLYVPGVGWSAGGLAGVGGKTISGYYLAQPNLRIRKGCGVALTADEMVQRESFAAFDFWGTASDGFGDEWFMPMGSAPILAWQTELTGLTAIPDVRGLTLQDARRVLSQAGFSSRLAASGEYSRVVPKDGILRTYPSAYAWSGSEVEVIPSMGPDTYDWTTNRGQGTSASPYEIQSARQLEDLAYRPGLWGRCFVLAADIDMTGRTYPTALIAPDVDGAKAGFQGIGFTGVFDGGGFKILNLQVITRTNDYLGLFGFVARDAIVKRITLENVLIRGGTGSTGNDSSGTGSDYVGSVAGYNAGTISSCYVSGSVAGHLYFGCVAGDSEGSIVDCQSGSVRIPSRSPTPSGLPTSL
jgi:hypothetical protein